MKKHILNFGVLFALILASVGFLLARSVAAAPNVVAPWAWNDVIGWIDFGYAAGAVEVMDSKLAGYANSGALGFLALDCATSPNGNVCGGAAGAWGISNTNGVLGGYAWNDNIGWVSFSGNQGGVTYGVEIGSAGVFSGFAWNDIVGWISFNCANDFDTIAPGTQASCAAEGGVDYFVKTSWAPQPGKIGALVSSIFDTGVVGGAQLNSVMWQGDQPQSTRVKFQIASSNNAAGPWNYLGPSGTSVDYYSPAGPNISAELARSQHFNKRYFRYAVTLESNPAKTKTPRVDDIIINWSR